jgi:hypothetical protein
MPPRRKRSVLPAIPLQANARQGNPNWHKQQSGRTFIESGDSGVFVTCDIGKEGKCIAETLDLFSQVAATNALI